MADRLTPSQRKAYNNSHKDYEKREAEERQKQYAPQQEFITNIGQCFTGNPHKVVKIITYHFESSSHVDLGSQLAIGSSIRYCCSECKVSFDPSVDPNYKEPPHPVRHFRY